MDGVMPRHITTLFPEILLNMCVRISTLTTHLGTGGTVSIHKCILSLYRVIHGPVALALYLVCVVLLCVDHTDTLLPLFIFELWLYYSS